MCKPLSLDFAQGEWFIKLISADYSEIWLGSKKHDTTRMHSSRMRTVRSSGRISGGVPGPGGVYLVRGGVPGRGCLLWGDLVPGGCTWSKGGCLLWGCTWSQGGVPGPGGCTWSGGVPSPGGCTWSGGVPGPGVYLALGGCAPGGVCSSGGCTWSGNPPCGQTDACKNITFATSLRTVTICERAWSP